jgi:hypothetical protein
LKEIAGRRKAGRPWQDAAADDAARRLVSVLTLAAPDAGRPADDPAAVKAVFKAYQKALLKRDGAAAAAVVDRGTVDY